MEIVRRIYEAFTAASRGVLRPSIPTSNSYVSDMPDRPSIPGPRTAGFHRDVVDGRESVENGSRGVLEAGPESSSRRPGRTREGRHESTAASDRLGPSATGDLAARSFTRREALEAAGLSE